MKPLLVSIQRGILFRCKVYVHNGRFYWPDCQVHWLTSTHKEGEPCLGDRYQGAKPPAGVWGTLSGGQVIPSKLPSLLCPTP